MLTLAAVVAYSAYVTRQIAGLRALQSELVERNRKDSLQLLRVQNDLNLLAISMRDMLDDAGQRPVTAWSAQLARIRTDLDDALRVESQLAPGQQNPGQREYLVRSLAQFWETADSTFRLAQAGDQRAARDQIRNSLQPLEAALSNTVARLLVQNNEREQQAAAQISEIYDGVQRQGYLFLAGTLVAILLTSLYLTYSNSQMFTRLAALSEQRSELAQKLIATQESTLRSLSRELHDEFGQILTALGTMMGRAGNQAPEGSPLRNDLQEVRSIAQGTLDRLRSLSQALHPVMLDELGLESTLDWYLPVVERQSGIKVSYAKSGEPFALDGTIAIHIYRILQEALNNVARHAGATEAWVRLRFLREALELEVEDHGRGFRLQNARQGIGLVAMRERAELLGGTLEFLVPSEGGTLVRLRVPVDAPEPHEG